MKKYKILCVILYFLFSLSDMNAHADCSLPPGYVLPKKLTLVTVARQSSAFFNILNEVYSQVFKEVGEALGGEPITLVLRSYPAKRAIIMLKYGEVDGDVWRLPEFAVANTMQDYMIKLDEPTFIGSFCAITYKKEIAEKINGWASFKGEDWRVNYLRGVVGPQIQLPKYLKKGNIGAVNRDRHGLMKLSYGRIDIYVGTSPLPQKIYNDPELKKMDFIIISNKLEAFTHCWLIKKHSPLVPFASEALRKYKKKIGIERVFKKHKASLPEIQGTAKVQTPFNHCL